MEHSSFTKHLPYVLKVCTTLDVNTKLFNNYLISFKIFLNVLFFFSTISCMSDSKGLLSDFLSKYHDLLVVLMSISVEICLIKYKSQFCTLIAFLMEPLEDFESNSVPSEIVKDYNREVALCGKVALAFYVFCAPYAFAPFLLMFDTSKLGNKECTDLAYGWVWSSDSYWYLIPVNIISVIFFLLENAVLFIYYLVMAYVVVKVRFTIRIICANLDDMNRTMNWSEERPSEFIQERFQPVKPGILVSGETRRSTGNSVYWEENSMIRTTQKTNDCPVSEVGRQQSIGRKEDILSYELQMKIWEKTLREQIELFMANMVERHVKIIRYVKLADIIFRIQIMVYVQLGMIAVAFAVPKLSLGKELINIDHSSQAMEFLGFLVLMGLISYIGQTLLDESESLRQALYSCDWTDKPHSLRRDLLIMQTVATKPLKLTVGGIYTLGMETYSNIVSAVYSYTSLIQTLK